MNISNKHKIFTTLKIKKVLLDALLVTFVFLVSQIFYNLEIVRNNVEDIAFDVVNKYIINKKETKVDAPNIFVLAIDDKYMLANNLFDNNNKTNYGYLFPRDKLAHIIENVDALCKEIDKKNTPKVLFLDYDIEFTSMPYSKGLSKQDKAFLEVLKKTRPYTIILPKSSAYNFVQQSHDKDIEKLIQSNKIVFASVEFLKTTDEAVRRYSAYNEFRELNSKKNLYPNVDLLLWSLMRKDVIPSTSYIQRTFRQKDIVSNRIMIKAYKHEKGEIQQSYWKNLTKLSASQNLHIIDEDDYKQSIIMVGGTYTGNGDQHNVLNFLSKEKISGVDLHANILLTMLATNPQIKMIHLYYGVVIVFITSFITSLLVSKILLLLKLYNTNYEFLVVLVVHTVTLVTISAFLLLHYSTWFNWFVPLVIIQVVDLVDFIRDYGPKFIYKILGEKR